MLDQILKNVWLHHDLMQKIRKIYNQKIIKSNFEPFAVGFPNIKTVLEQIK